MTTKPESPHVRVLFARDARGTLRVAWPREIHVDPRVYMRGEQKLPGTLRFEYAAGRRLMDLVETGETGDLLSQRVFDALTAAGARGWTSHPVEIEDSTGRIVSGYGLLIVTGRCGPLIPVPCHTGDIRDKIRSYRVDGTTWDGSDLFVPTDSDLILATPTVVDACAAIRATNIDFEAFRC